MCVVPNLLKKCIFKHLFLKFHFFLKKKKIYNNKLKGKFFIPVKEKMYLQKKQRILISLLFRLQLGVNYKLLYLFYWVNHDIIFGLTTNTCSLAGTKRFFMHIFVKKKNK